MTNVEKKYKYVESSDNLDDEHIINSLRMAIAQLDMSVHESSQSVELVIKALDQSSKQVAQIRELVQNCPTNTTITTTNNLDALAQELQEALIAFQFFDRLAQRIAHIQDNLLSVSSIIQEPKQEHSLLWKQLEEKMRSVFSQGQERRLYRALSDYDRRDKPQDDVMKQESANGSTELF